jgi:hypothetical protein
MVVAVSLFSMCSLVLQANSNRLDGGDDGDDGHGQSFPICLCTSLP